MQQIVYEIRPGEFADAMKSVRSGRMLFWLLLGGSILAQLAGFALVQYGGVLGSRPEILAAAMEKTAASQPAATPTMAPAPAAETPQPATAPATAQLPAAKWYRALGWILPATRFLAFVSAILLLMTLLLALNLALLGKLGGAAGLIGAFFWGLLLLAVVVPWQQVLTHSTLACGALFNLAELLAGRSRWAQAGGAWNETLYYLRFVGYPAVALVLWLVVHVKFSRGWAEMHFPHSVPSAVAPVAGPAVYSPPKVAAPPAPEAVAAEPAGGEKAPPQPAAETPAAETARTEAGKEPKKPAEPSRTLGLGSMAERFFRPKSGD